MARPRPAFQPAPRRPTPADEPRPHRGESAGRLAYDGQGRRIQKEIQNSADWDAAYHYYYSRGWQVLEERNGSGDCLRQYVWGARYVDNPIQIGINTDPSDSSEGPGENQCLVEDFYWPVQDTNFNVLGLVASDGTLHERYEYTPYGERTVYMRAGSNDATTSAPLYETQRVEVSSVKQPYGLCDFGHQGLALDKEFGQYYNRNRQYLPRAARFLNRDPAGYADGMSLYQYVGSRPLGWLDPMGLNNWGWQWGWPDVVLFPIHTLYQATGDITYFVADTHHFMDKEIDQLAKDRERGLLNVGNKDAPYGRPGGKPTADPLAGEGGWNRVQDVASNIAKTVPGTSITGPPSPPTDAAELAAEAIPAALKAADNIDRAWRGRGGGDVQRGGKTAQEQRARQREKELRERIRREEEQKNRGEEQRKQREGPPQDDGSSKLPWKQPPGDGDPGSGAAGDGAPPDSGDPYWECKKRGITVEPDTEKKCPPSSSESAYQTGAGQSP